MNTRPVSDILTIPKMCFISIFLMLILIQIGCTNPGKNSSTENANTLDKSDSNTSMNWVNVLITFKPNTTAEVRDMTIRAIEKLIMDSVYTMRKGNFPQFSPTFMISNNEIDGPLIYGLKAVANASTAPPIKDTICTCAHNCGVCAMLLNNLGYSPPSPNPVVPAISPFQNISTITDPVK